MRHRYALYPILVVLALGAPASADESPPVPSYDAARQEMEAARKADPDAPKFSEQDRAVMEQAAQDLAAQMPDPGLDVGDKAPDFTLPNAFGDPVSLYDQLEHGPVVLSFYRGAWCPYCNLEMHALHQSLPHFERLGASLVAVTPQKPDKSLEQVKKDGYPFEILSDLDSEVMKAYGLYFEVPEKLHEVYVAHGLDLTEYNGEGRTVLPVPGTFVVDADGIVRAVEADTDYRKRMEPARIIAALEAIAEGKTVAAE